jgi:hypothetical protein
MSMNPGKASREAKARTLLKIDALNARKEGAWAYNDGEEITANPHRPLNPFLQKQSDLSNIDEDEALINLRRQWEYGYNKAKDKENGLDL